MTRPPHAVDDTDRLQPDADAAAGPPVLALLAGVGLLLGVGAKLADESSLRWLAELGTSIGPWVFLVALVGVRSARPGVAAGRAAALLTTSVLAYDAVAVLVLGQPLGRVAVVWLLLAVTAVPAAAAAVVVARRRHELLGGVALGAAAGAVLAGGAVQRLAIAVAMGTLGEVPVRPAQALAELVLALVLVGWARGGAARGAAVGVALVVAAAATTVVPVALGLAV